MQGAGPSNFEGYGIEQQGKGAITFQLSQFDFSLNSISILGKTFVSSVKSPAERRE